MIIVLVILCHNWLKINNIYSLISQSNTAKKFVFTIRAGQYGLKIPQYFQAISKYTICITISFLKCSSEMLDGATKSNINIFGHVRWNQYCNNIVGTTEGAEPSHKFRKWRNFTGPLPSKRESTTLNAY